MAGDRRAWTADCPFVNVVIRGHTHDGFVRNVTDTNAPDHCWGVIVSPTGAVNCVSDDVWRWSDGTVDSHVSVEVPRLREAQQADLALVGFLAGMDAKVFGQGGAVGERLLAQSTAVRALAGVRPEVCGD